MTAVDSSVVVAGFATWHMFHAPARVVIDRNPSIIGHALIEGYSVLTRLPSPHRAEPDLVTAFLDATFPGEPLVLDPGELRALTLRLATLGITGGAVYDALIGATAVSHRQQLVTCDVRAAKTYERVGCRVRYLG